MMCWMKVSPSPSSPEASTAPRSSTDGFDLVDCEPSRTLARLVCVGRARK